MVLLKVILNYQQRAESWRIILSRSKYSNPHLNSDERDRAWKAFTIITISYNESEKGDEVQVILRDTLDSLLAIKDSTIKLDTVILLTKLIADTLATDCATNFISSLVAQGFFIGVIAVAASKITSTSPILANRFINVEPHSIAFSALYFWILPAVFSTSIIGVSQTESAISHILDRF